MLGLTDLKQTRFYQEAFADGRQEGRQEERINFVRRLANLGNSPEAIAQLLGLPLEEIQQILQPSDEERS
jgi:predicted transposase YdaD